MYDVACARENQKPKPKTRLKKKCYLKFLMNFEIGYLGPIIYDVEKRREANKGKD